MLIIALLAMALSNLAQAQSSATFSVDQHDLSFGSHDIGTPTPRTLVIKNESQAAAGPIITLSGKDAIDFSWAGNCPGNLPAGGTCNLSVSFSPMTIAESEERQAELIISDQRGAAAHVPLSGSAFQNLGAAPASLQFESRAVSTLSAPLSVVVTNYSRSTLGAVTVTVAGEFTVSPAKCEKIAPGGSCAFSIVFAPKTLGVAKGALTISAEQTNLGKLPRVVLLQGTASVFCNSGILSLWNPRVWLVGLIGGLFFAGLVLVRWHMIAKPARAQLVAAVNAVRARLLAETAGLPNTPELQGRTERIHFLLDWALYSFRNKSFPIDSRDGGREKLFNPIYPPWYTRLFNALFWPRGQEVAGWACAHEAEYELAELLAAERVRANLEMAEPQLRALKTPVCLVLADRIHEVLGPAPSPATLERERALLAEALALIYQSGDTDYFQLASWHAKMMWLVGCALLLIFALAATLQNAILLLLGAVGGLLSRLARTVQSAEVANDYGASWGALFLSPLSGALSAWGGILLIVLGLKFNIFGSAVSVDWCNPYEPATLAIALLFGFSERLFDGVVSQLENKFLKPPPGSPTPTSTPDKPAPKITGIDPASVHIGEPMSLKVSGANFLAGATATVTDENGNPAAATLMLTDASTVQVKADVQAKNPYTATLTITNPDKQFATFRFSVT